MQKTAVFIFLMLVAIFAVTCCTTIKNVIRKGYGTSTVAVYLQSKDGAMKKTSCQGIAFEENGGTYRFMVSSSCVAEDDGFHEVSRPKTGRLFIALDGHDSKNFFEAKIVAAGYQKRGDIFAVLEAKPDKSLETASVEKDFPNFKKFWTEVQAGKYKWFSSE